MRREGYLFELRSRRSLATKLPPALVVLVHNGEGGYDNESDVFLRNQQKS